MSIGRADSRRELPRKWLSADVRNVRPPRIACCVTVTCLLLSLGACSRKPEPQAAKGQGPPRKEHHVCAEWTMQGLPAPREGPPQNGYVFLEWIRDDPGGGIRHNYAVLTEGYGMMIFCGDRPPGQEYPTVRFKLFAHDRGLIVATTDLAELKRAIAQIPKGQTIRLIDTCCASIHSGMNPATRDETADFCRRRGIKFADNEEGVICTCA
jgi:hypothetical protein